MAGVPLAVGGLVVVATVAVGVAAVGAAAVRTTALAGVADAAALAVADTLAGAIGGDPCDRAGMLAARGGARLVSCTSDGLEARVVVEAPVGILTARARARAGPAPDDGPGP